jgi:hypothetical protein
MKKRRSPIFASTNSHYVRSKYTSTAYQLRIHNYSVSYIEPDAEVTDEITIEIYPEIRVIPIVPPIYICNTGAATYNFDLTKNTTIILTETIRHRVQLKIYTPRLQQILLIIFPILTH